MALSENDTSAKRSLVLSLANTSCIAALANSIFFSAFIEPLRSRIITMSEGRVWVFVIAWVGFNRDVQVNGVITLLHQDGLRDFAVELDLLCINESIGKRRKCNKEDNALQ